MLRLLSIATLLMIALCIAISASIALADESPEDVYEFDFAVEVETGPHPEFTEPNDSLDI